MGKSNWFWGETETPDQAGSAKAEPKTTNQKMRIIFWLLFWGAALLGIIGFGSGTEACIIAGIITFLCSLVFNFLQWLVTGEFIC